MAPILGTKWTIQKATEDSPFAPGQPLEITASAEVIYDGQPVAQGTYLEDKNKVTAFPESGEGNEYWELTGSEDKIGHFVLYGLSWTGTKPDAMGAWVCDPQGGSSRPPAVDRDAR